MSKDAKNTTTRCCEERADGGAPYLRAKAFGAISDF